MDKDSVISLDASGGPIVIEVEGMVYIERRVQMVLIGDSEATDVLFLATGDVDLGKKGQYFGTFLAPYGDVTLRDEAKLTGAMYGGKYVELKELAQLSSAPAVDLVVSRFAV